VERYVGGLVEVAVHGRTAIEALRAARPDAH